MHIGIVGSGQLARMLALAGWPMGMSFSFLATQTEDTCCVDKLGDVVRYGKIYDASALYQQLGCPEVITVEKEAVDAELLKALSQFCRVAPDPEIVAISQHRAREKQFLNAVGVDTVPYFHIKGKGQLVDACASIGFPVIVKSSEQGYDGLNQWRLNSETDLASLQVDEKLLSDAVVERRVNFTREISIIAARNAANDVAIYAPTENWHRKGTLLASMALVEELPVSLEEQLYATAHKILSAWNYVGVLAIECFVLNGKIVVNELAPRVHNSGHWTQQGCASSQFENHLRAITGMGLGSTQSYGQSAMINLLGRHASELIKSNPLAHVHLYNKALRDGRKMGHINLQCLDRAQLKQELAAALDSLYPELSEQVSEKESEKVSEKALVRVA